MQLCTCRVAVNCIVAAVFVETYNRACVYGNFVIALAANYRDIFARNFNFVVSGICLDKCITCRHFDIINVACTRENFSRHVACNFHAITARVACNNCVVADLRGVKRYSCCIRCQFGKFSPRCQSADFKQRRTRTFCKVNNFII